MRINLTLILAIAALVVALSGLAIAVGPTNVDGPLNVHQPGQVSLCLDTDDPSYGDDCWMSSSGGGFYLAAESGGFVMALDRTGVVFSIPRLTPLLRVPMMQSGNDATTAGPPLWYRTASWSGNVCIWAGAASNGGLTVYLERTFPSGWQNPSIMSSVVAKPGTIRPAFVTWLDGDPLDGMLSGIITDAGGAADYNRCYKVNVWAVADGPG